MSFSAEFKREAADLVLKQNYSYIEASRSLGVGESALRRWVDQVQQKRQGVTPQSKALFIEKTDLYRNAVHLRLFSVGKKSVARGFIPVGPRSDPQRLFKQIELFALATASQPNGDKSPRHKSGIREQHYDLYRTLLEAIGLLQYKTTEIIECPLNTPLSSSLGADMPLAAFCI